MRRIHSITRQAFAALAVLALALPARALPWCRCGMDEVPIRKAAPQQSHGCCCCQAKSAAGNSANDSVDRTNPDSHSTAPRSCPSSCTSPCSLGKPTFEVSSHKVTEFFEARPAGVTALLTAQQPCPPTLDGLLRPPRT